MKKLDKLMTLVFAGSLVLLMGVSNSVAAQDVDDPEVDIPFIDRDGDGINDLLQHGWGLRFRERYQQRQAVWEQLNVEVTRGERGMMVDLDGDGVGDQAFSEFIQGKMDELIDTDGDGVPDTPLGDYLGRRFRAFDHDGDGLPDDISREELRERMREMQNWRREIHERMRQGLPAFEDTDGDGIPDNLPEDWGRRRHTGNDG